MTDTSIEELEHRFREEQECECIPGNEGLLFYKDIARDAIALLKLQEKDLIAICDQRNGYMKEVARLNRFIRESGTTLDACQCGRGKKPKYDMCEVCEREGEIGRLRMAIETVANKLATDRDYIDGVEDLRKALGEER